MATSFFGFGISALADKSETEIEQYGTSSQRTIFMNLRFKQVSRYQMVCHLADNTFPEIGQTYQPAIYVMHPKNVRVLKIPNMH